MTYQKLSVWILIICACYTPMHAQLNGPWTPVGQIKRNTVEEAIVVSSEKDIDKIKSKPSLLSDAFSVKIQNIQNPSELFKLFTVWQDIGEVYLKNSGALLKREDFSILQHVDHIIVEVGAEDSNLLVNIADIPSLEKITLILKEVPENWDFLYYYQKIKKLHIYANFLPEDLHKVVDKLMVFHKLQELGLSVDFATDLPRNLNLIAGLKILKLYDNHSRINHQNMMRVQPESFNIVGILGNDQPIQFSVLFYAQDFGLTYREHKYLEQIWMGRKIGFEPLDELPEIRGKKDMYKLAPKPDFPHPDGLDLFLQGLYPDAESFKINPDQNNILHTRSGMNIYIPAGSILNNNDKSYTGNAFVSIRYMNNLLDMAMRGMDLKVTRFQGSPLYQASTAFEIQISDGVFPLKFSGAVNIKVEIPNRDTSASLYYFDSESKGFLDYELFKLVNQSSDQKIIPIRYDEWLRKDLANHHYYLDERPFNDRFIDPDNFFLLDKDVKAEKFVKNGRYFTAKVMPWSKIQINPKNIRTVKEGRKLLSVKRMNIKGKSKNDLFYSITEPSDLFNELRFFRKRVFKYADTLDRKMFANAFSRGIRYSDFRLETKHPQKHWEFILKSDLGYKIIKTEAALYNRKGKKISERKTQKILNKYHKTQKDRALSFNNFLETRKQSYAEFFQKRQNDWEKKGQFKSIFIQNEGIYSFMTIAEKDENEIDLHLTYLTSNGLPIDVKDLIVIDKTAGNVRKINKGNVKLNIENISLLLCTDFQNNLYYLTGDHLRNSGLTDGSIFFIKMNSLGFMPRNIAEIKNQIKFEKLK
jgi:hypothetical protein